MDPLIERMKADKTASTVEGSSLRGDKILACARKIIPKAVTKGSSTHNIQRVDLEANAYAVINKQFRLLASPKGK